QLAALGRRIGREDSEPLVVQGVVGQRKTGALMHGMIVVDDGDLPLPDRLIVRNRSGVVDQVEDIVLFGHCVVPSAKLSELAGSPHGSPLAVRGMIMRKVVPCPGLDSSIILPPSC